MTAPYRPSSAADQPATPSSTGPYPAEPPTTRMEVPLTTPPPGTAPRFADLPASPAAYHEDETPGSARSSRGRTPVSALERLVYVVGAVLAVLVLAKVGADTTDLDTNVFDVLLYAVLAMIVGVVVVGVGGALITPMRERWTSVLRRR